MLMAVHCCAPLQLRQGPDGGLSWLIPPVLEDSFGGLKQQAAQLQQAKQGKPYQQEQPVCSHPLAEAHRWA